MKVLTSDMPPPAYHGAIDFAELERLDLDPDQVLDFSVNSNAFGPSPNVVNALASVPLDRYPDRESLQLRRDLSLHLGVDVDQIVVGNGTAELLWLTALAFLQAGDRVFVLGPSFGEYIRVSQLVGAQITEWTAQPEQDFQIDLHRVAQAIRDVRPKLVFLCNPNNPTGVLLSHDVINSWAAEHPNTIFAVDEAYLRFAPAARSVIPSASKNVLTLRSMTKDYALAGLRLGYAVADEAMISRISLVRPPWNVNAIAQEAGIAALADEDHLRESMSKISDANQELVAGLIERGLNPFPSSVHFFLLRAGDGAAFRRELLAYGILVRDCASFGLPDVVRIATRRPEENVKLLSAIDNIQAGRQWPG